MKEVVDASGVPANDEESASLNRQHVVTTEASYRRFLSSISNIRFMTVRSVRISTNSEINKYSEEKDRKRDAEGVIGKKAGSVTTNRLDSSHVCKRREVHFALSTGRRPR